MRLNLPGNTGKTPATYVSTFKRLGVKTTYEQRYTEAHDWRQSTPNAAKLRKAAQWMTKYAVK
jgi:hypothetical protein